jgi:D-proline reductase (dithiol) PrdB
VTGTAIDFGRFEPLGDRAGLDEKFADWLRRIHRMHEGAVHRANPEATLAPLPRPLSGCRVALLTSAGAYVEGDEPFDVASPHGDPSHRVIPGDVDLARLRFAHSHYDTARAEADPNVVLPLDPLRACAADGRIGEVSPVHVGMMGFNPDPLALIEREAPAVVDVLRSAGVDAVVLSPG